MSGKHAAIVLLAVLVGAWLAWLARGRGPEAAPPPALEARPAAVDAGEISPIEPTEEPATEDPRAARQETRRAVEPEPEAPVEQGERAERGGARLVGRLLLPDGSPAAGASLRVEGQGTSPARSGASSGVRVDSGTTDAEGRFDITLERPRGYAFKIDAELAGYAELSWRFESLPEGVTDLGEQRLEESAAIVGSIVGTDGTPLAGDWSVCAHPSQRPTGQGAYGNHVRATVDARTGAFRIDALPPGPVTLEAYSSFSGWIDGPSARLAAGEETRADIVYDAPEIDRRIVVSTRGQPFVDVDPKNITCTGADGRSLASRKVPRNSQRYDFTGLEPGVYTIEITSPLHLPWSRSGVRPGERVEAHLEGNASITLALSDARTGEPVLDYGLEVEFHDVGYGSTEVQARAVGTPHSAGGRYDGLIPRDATLFVDAPGYAPLEIHAGELAPLQTRHVEGELHPGGTLRGDVRKASGGSVPWALVQLYPDDEDYDPDDPFAGLEPGGRWLDARSQETETGADGRFSFERIVPGDYRVRASRGIVETPPLRVEISAGENAGVTLELPGAGAIAGRLQGPPGASFRALGLVAWPEGVDEPSFESASPLARTAVQGDGSYRLEPVTEGRATVYLAMPDHNLAGAPLPPAFAPAALLELGTVDVHAGAEARADYDLRERFPGSIRVTVRVNGQPASGSRVQAVQHDEGVGIASLGGELDPDGRLRLLPLFVGEWKLSVKGPEGWTYEHPPLVRVGSAEEVAVLVDVPIAAGRVHVLDATTGKPLSNRRLLSMHGGWWVTDGEGWLDLVLPPGEYEVSDLGEGGLAPGPPATLEWSAAGPATRELRLTPGGGER